jgi:hypothetical protein
MSWGRPARHSATAAAACEADPRCSAPPRPAAAAARLGQQPHAEPHDTVDVSRVCALWLGFPPSFKIFGLARCAAIRMLLAQRPRAAAGRSPAWRPPARIPRASSVARRERLAAHMRAIDSRASDELAPIYQGSFIYQFAL